MADVQALERIEEEELEQDVLRWVQQVDWQVGAYGELERSEATYLDEKYERETSEVIYWNLLREKLLEINGFLVDDDVDDVISSLKRDLKGDNLINQNRHFYKILRKGKKVSVPDGDGGTETKYANLIDFDNPSNNSFIATNQFRVKIGKEVIPDFVLLVNGIPIVIGELKSLAQDADWHDGYNDLKAYEKTLPELFVPALFNVTADEREFRYGAVGIGKDFYNPWRKDEEDERSDNEPRDAVESLFQPGVLLDMLKYFVFYAEATGGDNKIVPRYMQYYASHKLMDRIENGQHDRGLYWHTQGSGKSYTMLFTAVNLMLREGKQAVIRNPQVIIVVDQDKLRRQMSGDMSAVGIEEYHVAQSINDLQKQIEEGKSQILLTTIQMFQDVDPDSQGNPNTVLMIDEAHRFMEQDLGNKLEGALPDAYHFAFTGTPVREDERDTFKTYCPPDELYHHRYSIKAGLHDGVILPVQFDVRHVMEWEFDRQLIDEKFDKNIGDMTVEEKDKVLKEHFTTKDLAELRNRVSSVAEEIVEHFESGPEPNGWKGMVVTPSRKAAAIYGEELLKFRDPEDVKVLISESRDVGPHEPFMDKFYTTDEEKESIVKNFKEKDQPKILVVCNMLLTGFDAPNLKTMYLDRFLTDHTLLQAIARTNRPAPGKVNGEIVDFVGVFDELEEALDYPDEVREHAAFDRDELIEDFETLLDETMAIFESVDRSDGSDTLNQCLTLLTKRDDLRKQFETNFRNLQDYYETLSPDKRLAQDEVRDPYRWLNQVWVAHQRSYNRKEQPDEEIKEKTKEILEENVSVSVSDIMDEFPVYEINEEHLEQLEKMEPSARATEIAHAVKDQLDEVMHQNPLYESLSERLTDLLKDWRAGNLSDSVFAKKGKKIEEEYIEVKNTPEKREMTPAEYAIEELLKKDYDHHLEGNHNAEEIARTIGDAFDEEIDTDYDGWKENPETLRQIRQTIIQTIVKDLNQPGLYHADNFVDRVRDYLVENKAEK